MQKMIDEPNLILKNHYQKIFDEIFKDVVNGR